MMQELEIASKVAPPLDVTVRNPRVTLQLASISVGLHLWTESAMDSAAL